MMKIIMSCLSGDTEFIDVIKKEFEKTDSLETFTMSGITGYEMVMLIVSVAGAIGAYIPFIVKHMSNNKDDNVKSHRSISIELDNKHIYKIESEGCSEYTIRELLKDALGKDEK